MKKNAVHNTTLQARYTITKITV